MTLTLSQRLAELAARSAATDAAAAAALADLLRDGAALAAAMAAAADAAAACGVGDSKGRIAVGFDADVVAFAGHPADDLDAIHEPVGVWTRGVRAR